MKTRSDRQETSNRRLIDMLANVGMHDPAAFHHEDAVGDIENETQHLLADDDTKIADTADVAQQPRNILDDRRLDALGRLVQQ